MDENWNRISTLDPNFHWQPLQQATLPTIEYSQAHG
jgi:hypothetical protein